jgi:predicted DNA-binding transcriptional regulator AlpA
MPVSILPHPTTDRLLSLDQVCEVLGGYSRWQIRVLVASRRFPAPIRLTGFRARPRWHASTVDAWLAAQLPKDGTVVQGSGR